MQESTKILADITARERAPLKQVKKNNTVPENKESPEEKKNKKLNDKIKGRG